MADDSDDRRRRGSIESFIARTASYEIDDREPATYASSGTVTLEHAVRGITVTRQIATTFHAWHDDGFTSIIGSGPEWTVGVACKGMPATSEPFRTIEMLWVTLPTLESRSTSFPFRFDEPVGFLQEGLSTEHVGELSGVQHARYRYSIVRDGAGGVRFSVSSEAEEAVVARGTLRLRKTAQRWPWDTLRFRLDAIFRDGTTAQFAVILEAT